MTAQDLYDKLAAHGVRLVPKLAYEGATDVLTPEVIDELRRYKDDVLRLVIDHDHGEMTRLHEDLSQRSALWRNVCWEIAEAAGWPRVAVHHRVGHVGPGEAMWRAYLKRAPLPELRYGVLPELRTILHDVGVPD